MDHTYITDKGKVYRKNHLSLRHNFNHPKFSATPGTVRERLQRRIALRPQSQPSTSPAPRQTNELSKCTCYIASRFGSRGCYIESSGCTSSDKPHLDIFHRSSSNASGSAHHTSAKDFGTVPQTATQGPAATGHTEDGDPTTQYTSDSTKSSGRSKKPTRFYGDAFRHSVKSVTDSDPAEFSSQQPIPEQTITTPFTPTVRKGSQLLFRRTKEQTTPFKKIRIDEHNKTS